MSHRLEWIKDVDGVSFFNDSKATNVNSCWYALESMPKNTILILGGKDKGNDYSEIEQLVKNKVKAIEMLKKSKFLNPTNPHVYFLLGVLLFETEKINEAFIEFKQLEEFNPKYKNLNYYLALCYKKEKNYISMKLIVSQLVSHIIYGKKQIYHTKNYLLL